MQIAPDWALQATALRQVCSAQQMNLSLTMSLDDLQMTASILDSEDR